VGVDMWLTKEPEIWFTEKHTENLGITFKVKKTLFSGESKYQRIDILDTYELGRVLTLDGIIMITERDEFVYHEMIAHVPLFTHPNPKRILVVGGGDGGTVREVLKHPQVQTLDLVEIDALVIEKSKEFFPTTRHSFSDERVNIFIKDGVEFMKGKSDEYDIVIIDSTDPTGPGEGLFKEEFYRDVNAALKDDGIMVAQTETPFYYRDQVHKIFMNIKKSFPLAKMFTAYIPTYPSGLWSFSLGSKKYCPVENFQLDRYKSENIPTKYYNEDIHRAAFSLPNFIKELLL